MRVLSGAGGSDGSQLPNRHSVFGIGTRGSFTCLRWVSVGRNPSASGVRLSVLTVGYDACVRPVKWPLARFSVVTAVVAPPPSLSSERTIPVMGDPSGLRAIGTLAVSRLLPGSTSGCQPLHTIV